MKSFFNKKKELLPKSLRIHLLIQILKGKASKLILGGFSLSDVEQELGRLCINLEDCDSRFYYTPCYGSGLTRYMHKNPLCKNDVSYSLKMQWRVHYIQLNLGYPDSSVRKKYEEFLLKNINKGYKEYLNLKHFRFDLRQLDHDGEVIEYSKNRAKIHAIIHPMSDAHINIYNSFKDPFLTKKILSFIEKSLASEHPQQKYLNEKFNTSRRQVITDIYLSSGPTMKSTMARSQVLCNRYFDSFLEPSLTIPCLEAIITVNWQKFINQTSPQSVKNAATYMARVFKLNHSLKIEFADKFN